MPLAKAAGRNRVESVTLTAPPHEPSGQRQGEDAVEEPRRVAQEPQHPAAKAWPPGESQDGPAHRGVAPELAGGNLLVGLQRVAGGASRES